MALLSDYTAGTVSSSGLVITGTGTAWQTAQFREGDEFIADGWRMLVQSVDSETQLTLRANSGVQGSALSGASYRLRYMSDGSRSSAQARQLIDMLSGTGTLEGLAGLTTAANKMPYFTGPGGAAALTDLTEFGRALASLTGANGSIPVATGAGTAAMRAIVGTVSQSGGVPTGALMETGSNANGRYLRFADGTQICWHRASNFTATDVASGVLYQAATPVAFAFPASFATPPIVSVIADKQGGGSGALWGVMSSNQPTAGGIAFTLLSTTSGAQAKAAYIATGRWFA